VNRRTRAAFRVALMSVASLMAIGWAWTNDAAATTVRVRPGSTLTQIASTYGTSVAALVTYNGIGDPNLIEAGTVIDIPTSAASSGYTSDYSSSSSGSVTVTVARGDTLWSLASQYGTSVAAIVGANGIADPSHVEMGTQISVPTGAAYGGATGAGGGPLSLPTPGSTLPAGLLAHPQRLALRPVFERWASEFGLPEQLLEAMCWWESGWQMSAVSSTGAVGIGQLEPSTVAKLRVSLGQPGLQATNTSDNIEMAAAYLHQLLIQTRGDAGLALAGYYQGLNSVQRSGMFPSTVQYVNGILAFTEQFA
jgi:LysM repeat protein